MSRASTRNCAEGHSALELLVALALSVGVGAGVLALALSSRGLYDTERARTRLNQSLRAGRDFLVTDLRQAGERLDPNFPAIEIVRGEDLPGGAAGDPDELVLRRNLHETVLWVCADVAPADDDVWIALTNLPPPGCAPLPVEPGDVYPRNLQDWSDYRTSRGGAVRAYIYNPVAQQGEFFTFESEAGDAAGFYLSKAAGFPDWSFAYPAGDQVRVYLLEERRYRVSGDMLQVVVDADTADPVNLVDTITNFQVQTIMKPTLANPTPPLLDSFDGIGWDGLSNVQVSVAGRVDVRNRSIARSFSSTITPRNVL